MKILIVDDSELLQIRLRRALLKADMSMTISQAYTVREAMDLFHSFGPDGVVLDIDLPDGSGIDLLQTFKKEQREVVVAMFTNFPTSEFKESCLSLGANYFFEKSDISSLIQSITHN
jgi:DNA-binding response OmpR family regulator